MLRKELEPEEVLLSNGIPVIFQHYEGSVAATYWWVRTGSADEKPTEAGYAHFLEHMLFKDAAAKETGLASTGKTASAIESLGGDINAYTSFDQTVYHVTCAARHWEKVLDSFGPMAKPQRFLKSDFMREREVILEELRKNEDSPGRQLFQKIFSLSFKKHPYGRPVIGFVKTLKAATAASVEGYYRRQYVPGRMGLVLVGPLHDAKGARRKAILARLEKHFGQATLRKPGGAKVLPAPFPRPREAEVRAEASFATLPFDVKTPSLCLAFRTPELLHEDTPALDLLAGILGMGELSRLYQKLFYEKSLVTNASGGLYVPKDPGFLHFQVDVASTDKLNTVAGALFRELKRLGDEGPTKEELDRVIVNVESEKLYATQTADGMASRLGFLRFVVDDLAFDRRFLEELRAVDAARIRATARKYLDYHRMSAVAMVPKGETFDMGEIRDLARRFLKTEEAAQKPALLRRAPLAASSPSPVELLRLPSGIRVVHFERPQSHVISVNACALGGLRLELGHPLSQSGNPLHDWGTSYLMAMTWAKGTSKLDSNAIARESEGRAASIEGSSGRNTVGLHMTGLARDWAPLSELFSQVLFDASFPEDELEHSRRVAEDAVRGIDDHSSQLCSKLFLETLFEHHPYGKLTTGSLESLAAIRREKLLAYHRAWLRPDRLVLAVSGALSRADLDAWLKDFDQQAQQFAAAHPAREIPTALGDEPALKAPRWVERALGREQLHILVGTLGAQMHSDDRHALRLMQTLLGGQSGRLFIELREKKSLAYTVSPVSFEGIERGYAGTYIACAPNKREEALAGIRTVLEKLSDKGPTDSEIRRAKEYYLGRRAIDMQNDSSLASYYSLETLYNFDQLTEDEITRKVHGVTGKQIREACRKYMVEPKMVTASVG